MYNLSPGVKLRLSVALKSFPIGNSQQIFHLFRDKACSFHFDIDLIFLPALKLISSFHLDCFQVLPIEFFFSSPESYLANWIMCLPSFATAFPLPLNTVNMHLSLILPTMAAICHLTMSIEILNCNKVSFFISDTNLKVCLPISQSCFSTITMMVFFPQYWSCLF